MVIASNMCLLLLLLSNKQQRGPTRVRCYGKVVVSISADKQCKLICEEENFYSTSVCYLRTIVTTLIIKSKCKRRLYYMTFTAT